MLFEKAQMQCLQMHGIVLFVALLEQVAFQECSLVCE
jgi:hypothetical protein